MPRLTDEQVLAAATERPLVNIVSAPGSGKTTVAAERFGYRKFRSVGSKGVLGVSFTKSAAAELRSRINARWGSDSTTYPHCVSTFDEFHVRLFQWLLDQSLVAWPGRGSSSPPIKVHDDYSGFRGYRPLPLGSWSRHAALSNEGQVYSKATRTEKRRLGISTAADHKAILAMGECSHEDLRNLLWEALDREDVWSALSQWIAANYSDLIVDEIYDAAELDLLVTGLAGQAGLNVTVIGDPWQAVYGWRGATPDKVSVLLDTGFREFPLSRSFRFRGEQMPKLAADLRQGTGLVLPEIGSSEIDVAIARQWKHLLRAGENILPLAFRNIKNQTDALLNLLLDTVIKAHFGRASFGRDGALIQLGLNPEEFDNRQEELLQPILEMMIRSESADDVMDQLRSVMPRLGKKRPNRLSAAKESIRIEELELLAERLQLGRLIPGMTVHQAKGREWRSVGVVLTSADEKILGQGLRPLTDDHCILYVALTRARDACGRIAAID